MVKVAALTRVTCPKMSVTYSSLSSYLANTHTTRMGNMCVSFAPWNGAAIFPKAVTS